MLVLRQAHRAEMPTEKMSLLIGSWLGWSSFDLYALMS